MAFINSILSIFTQKRLAQIDFFKANPIKVQRDTLQELLTLAATPNMVGNITSTLF